MNLRVVLPASLLLALTLACGTPTPAAPPSGAVESPTPSPTVGVTRTATPLRDEVLLDVVGTGELRESRTFTIRGASVNICWRLTGSGEATPPELVIRLHDALTREERGLAASAGTPSGCRAVPVRSVGQPHYLSVATAAGTAWHVAVVGQ